MMVVPSGSLAHYVIPAAWPFTSALKEPSFSLPWADVYARDIGCGDPGTHSEIDMKGGPRRTGSLPQPFMTGDIRAINDVYVTAVQRACDRTLSCKRSMEKSRPVHPMSR